MIFIIRADTREVNSGIDAQWRQDLLVTNSGQFKELRCADRPGREDDFSTRLNGNNNLGVIWEPNVDTSCPDVPTKSRGAELKLRDERLAKHDEVASQRDWVLVCKLRGLACAILL